MKATLEFDLSDPEDQMAHLRCVKAEDMALVLFDFDRELRNGIKWTDKQWDEVRDMLSQCMGKRNIDLDELIR